MVVKDHPPGAIAPQKTAAPRTQQGEQSAGLYTAVVFRSGPAVTPQAQDPLTVGAGSSVGPSPLKEPVPLGLHGSTASATLLGLLPSAPAVNHFTLITNTITVKGRYSGCRYWFAQYLPPFDSEPFYISF